MNTQIINNLHDSVTVLKNLLDVCNDDVRRASMIAYVNKLIGDANIYYLNYQLEQAGEELYNDITGVHPVKERPCEI